MTILDLNKLLNSSGVKFAYHHWKSKQKSPCGVFLVPSTANFKADGKVCIEISQARIELYTDKKDPVSEQKIKTVLDGAEIFYEQTSETFIEAEELYQVVYEIEI